MDDAEGNHEPPLPLSSLRKLALEELQAAKARHVQVRHEKIRLNLAKELTSFSEQTSRKNLNRAKSKALASIRTVGPVASEVVMENKERPPDGVQWVRAQTNTHLSDNYATNFNDFTPYLGETDEKLRSSTNLANELFDGEPEKDISDIEGLEDDDEEEEEGEDDYVIRGRSGKSGKKKSRPRSGKRPSTGYQPSKVGDFQWNRAVKRLALNRLVESIGFTSSKPFIDAVSSAFSFSSKSFVETYVKLLKSRSDAWLKKDEEDKQIDRSKRDILKMAKGEADVTIADALADDSIPFFFCRRCYVYNCSSHGWNVRGRPKLIIPDKTRKDALSKNVSEAIESNCEDKWVGSCWVLSQKEEECSSWWADFSESSSAFADDIKALLKDLLPVFGADYCRVSECIRTLVQGKRDPQVVTCARIGYMSTTLFKDLVKKQVLPRWRAFKSRTATPVIESQAMNGALRPDYEPCHHTGPCTSKNCSCVQEGVHCEKYCGCNLNRPNQTRNAVPCNWAFRGCSCKSAVACISKACVCFSWKRECDPDLCRSCHDCKDHERPDDISCCNVGLRVKKAEPTLAGRSEVHGWGLFAGRDILRNAIIGEYVGEVVDEQDAERRGRLYDILKSSFLFEITRGYALDSTRMGNKLRYCNHSSNPNCEPRLMRVAGDIRIAIFAKRDIREHEELFFDYGDKFIALCAMGEDGKEAGKKRKGDTKMKKINKKAKVDDDYSSDDVIILKEDTKSLSSASDDDFDIFSRPPKSARSERNNRRSSRSKENGAPSGLTEAIKSDSIPIQEPRHGDANTARRGPMRNADGTFQRSGLKTRVSSVPDPCRTEKPDSENPSDDDDDDDDIRPVRRVNRRAEAAVQNGYSRKDEQTNGSDRGGEDHEGQARHKSISINPTSSASHNLLNLPGNDANHKRRHSGSGKATARRLSLNKERKKQGPGERDALNGAPVNDSKSARHKQNVLSPTKAISKVAEMIKFDERTMKSAPRHDKNDRTPSSRTPAGISSQKSKRASVASTSETPTSTTKGKDSLSSILNTSNVRKNMAKGKVLTAQMPSPTTTVGTSRVRQHNDKNVSGNASDDDTWDIDAEDSFRQQRIRRLAHDAKVISSGLTDTDNPLDSHQPRPKGRIPHCDPISTHPKLWKLESVSVGRLKQQALASKHGKALRPVSLRDGRGNDKTRDAVKSPSRGQGPELRAKRVSDLLARMTANNVPPLSRVSSEVERADGMSAGRRSLASVISGDGMGASQDSEPDAGWRSSAADRPSVKSSVAGHHRKQRRLMSKARREKAVVDGYHSPGPSNLPPKDQGPSGIGAAVRTPSSVNSKVVETVDLVSDDQEESSDASFQPNFGKYMT